MGDGELSRLQKHDKRSLQACKNLTRENLDIQNRRRHEAQQKYQQRYSRCESPPRIERNCIVDWRAAQKAQSKENGCPDIPSAPVPEETEQQQQYRQECRNNAMAARAHRAQNMPAIQLARRQQIQGRGKKSDPRCSPHGVQEKIVHRHARMNDRRQ